MHIYPHITSNIHMHIKILTETNNLVPSRTTYIQIRAHTHTHTHTFTHIHTHSFIILLRLTASGCCLKIFSCRCFILRWLQCLLLQVCLLGNWFLYLYGEEGVCPGHVGQRRTVSRLKGKVAGAGKDRNIGNF